jgi:biopolymer transport protein ExbD
MGYESDQRSGGGSAAAVLAVVIVALLVLGLLVVGVGALFFVRARVATEEVMVAQERAMVARVEAQARQEQLAQQLEQAVQAQMNQAPQLSTTSRLVSVRVDAEGQMRVDGDPHTSDQLPVRLKELLGDQQVPLSIDITADAECRAEQLTELLSIVWQQGIRDIRIHTSPVAATE